ncbi:MAG TPA: hypothetical protein QF520_06845, partial [SAR202 cluster bacterium]|nr:hypothetical protein [SAR202 cluster bacterium]
MIETSRYMSNAAALKRVGIRLLPGEQMDAAVELESGLTDELFTQPRDVTANQSPNDTVRRRRSPNR